MNEREGAVVMVTASKLMREDAVLTGSAGLRAVVGRAAYRPDPTRRFLLLAAVSPCVGLLVADWTGAGEVFTGDWRRSHWY